MGLLPRREEVQAMTAALTPDGRGWTGVDLITAAREVVDDRVRAVGFIDQTIYANEDNGAGATWRNDEVLGLLREVRRQLVPDLVDLAALTLDGHEARTNPRT
jgi:hypothetical protein